MTDKPGVIAPPPLIFLGCFLLGLSLDFASGFLGIALPWPLRWLLALAAIGGGVRILLKSLRALKKAGTRPEPWQPTTAIVDEGPYARSRNPIYVAMALIHLGLAVACDGIFALMALMPALLAIRYGVIEREEAYLEAKFGEPYRAYMNRVRRWA